MDGKKKLDELVARVDGAELGYAGSITFAELRSISDAFKVLEVALRLADDWLPFVEPHLRDSAAFKRDYGVIRAALEESRHEG